MVIRSPQISLSREHAAEMIYESALMNSQRIRSTDIWSLYCNRHNVVIREEA